MIARPLITNGEFDAILYLLPARTLTGQQADALMASLAIPMPASGLFDAPYHARGMADVMEATPAQVTAFDEPITTTLRVMPNKLLIGDVLTANQIRPNGMPYTRRYEITGACELVDKAYRYCARWLDDGSVWYPTFGIEMLRMETVTRVVKG